MKKSIGMIIILGCIGIIDASEAVALPEWSISDWFNVSMNMLGDLELTSNDVDVFMDAALHSSESQWTVIEKQVKQIPLCNESTEVYVLRSSGGYLNGNGTADVAGIDFDWQTDDGNFSIEVWIRTSDLSPVYCLIDADVTIIAYLFNNWVELGILTLQNLEIAFCPALQDFSWSLEVGDTWTNPVTMRYLGLLDFEPTGIIPFPLDDWHLAGAQFYSFNAVCPRIETIGDCESYRIEMNDSGAAQMINFYCPFPFAWYSRKEVHNITVSDGDGVFHISDCLFHINDVYHSNEIPTPTPTVVTPTPFAGYPLEIDLSVNGSLFYPGEPVSIYLTILNNTEPLSGDTWIILEYNGMYFFYPSWTMDSGYQNNYYRSGLTIQEVITFNWPDEYGLGQLLLGECIDTSSIKVWVGIFQPDQLDIDHLYAPIFCNELTIQW